MKPTVPFIHLGFGNAVATARVLAIMVVGSAPTKRLIQEARRLGRLVDMSYGRMTKSAVLFDTGHIALSTLDPRTLVKRAEDIE